MQRALLETALLRPSRTQHDTLSEIKNKPWPILYLMYCKEHHSGTLYTCPVNGGLLTTHTLSQEMPNTSLTSKTEPSISHYQLQTPGPDYMPLPAQIDMALTGILSELSSYLLILLLFTQELRDAEDDNLATIHRLMDEFVCVCLRVWTRRVAVCRVKWGFVAQIHCLFPNSLTSFITVT